MSKYTMSPRAIEAIKYTGTRESHGEVTAFIGEMTVAGHNGITWGTGDDTRLCFVGDYVVKNESGKCQMCSEGFLRYFFKI